MVRTRMTSDVKEWSRGVYIFKSERELPNVYKFRRILGQRVDGDAEGHYNFK